jgi:uncharacterized protein (DUF1778 family)
MKRRKPKAARKDEQVRVRLTAEQKQKLTDAATRAGLDVSTWLRSIGLREADKVISDEQR